MVGLDDFKEPILNQEVVSALEANKHLSFDYLNWIIYPLLVLIALVVLAILVVFIVKKIKQGSLPSEFKQLIHDGKIALQNKDLNSAEKIYNQMKKMSEKSQNKKMFSVSLDFYKKIVKTKGL